MKTHSEFKSTFGGLRKNGGQTNGSPLLLLRRSAAAQGPATVLKTAPGTRAEDKDHKLDPKQDQEHEHYQINEYMHTTGTGSGKAGAVTEIRPPYVIFRPVTDAPPRIKATKNNHMK